MTKPVGKEGYNPLDIILLKEPLPGVVELEPLDMGYAFDKLFPFRELERLFEIGHLCRKGSGLSSGRQTLFHVQIDVPLGQVFRRDFPYGFLHGNEAKFHCLYVP